MSEAKGSRANHSVRKPPPKSEPLNAAQILAKGREPREFLVTQKARPDSGSKDLGIIPVNSYTLLVAETNHGKTWISLDLARLMATPREQRPAPLDWLGMYDVEHRRVLYLDEENGEPLIGERLGRLGLEDTADLIVWSRCGLKVDLSNQLDQMIDYCLETERQVVFLDSLVRFHRKEENDAQAMAEVAAAIRTLVANNLTVVVLHHTGKGKMRNVRDEDKQRGSSEIMAGADTGLFLEKCSKDGSMFMLSASKLRYASREKFRKHRFRWNEQDGRICFVHVNDVDEKEKEKEKEGASSATRPGKSGLESNEQANPKLEEVYERVRQLINRGQRANVTEIRKGLGNNITVKQNLDKLVESKRLDTKKEGRNLFYCLIDKSK